jgi:hypothetical protein
LAVAKTLRTSSGLDGDLRGTNDTHLRVASSGSAETRAQGCEWTLQNAYYRVKLIVTVTRTGTGTPFSSVGVYTHCRTASSAA